MRFVLACCALALATHTSAAQSCPATLQLGTIPSTSQNTRHFDQVHPAVKHPTLSINGFSCSRPGGDCANGFGFKEVLQAVYPASTDDAVTVTFRRVVSQATSPLLTPSDESAINANILAFQARGVVALVTFLLFEANLNQPANLNACNVGVTLPDHATALTSFKEALRSTSWVPNMSYDGDAIHWGDQLQSIARAMDYYLALENAYEELRPQSAGAALLTAQEKNNLLYEFSRAIAMVHGSRYQYSPFYSDRYDGEPGNWSTSLKTAVGYAALTQQIYRPPNLPQDFCYASGAGPCPNVDWTRTAFKSVLATSNGDRHANYGWQTGDGQRFWAEGAYYFDIVVNKVVPFLHAARINNLFGNTSVTGFASPYTDDPFDTGWLNNPLGWLADTATPLGESVPLDDGNKLALTSAGLLRWTSAYGSDSTGFKFARVAQRAGQGINPFLDPVELAIPRRPLLSGTYSDARGRISGVAPSDQDDQQLVLRRPVSDVEHYVLLNGERGAAYERGEGHEQADQAQLLYYVGGTSVLMDSGYDDGKPNFNTNGEFLWINSRWNRYRDHNVLHPIVAPPGLRGPDLQLTTKRKLITPYIPSYLYRSHHNKVDALHIGQTLPFAVTNVQGQEFGAMYYRDVLFIGGPDPYLIDFNRVQHDLVASQDRVDDKKFEVSYHLDTDGINATDYHPSTGMIVSNPIRGSNNRVFLYPVGIEYALSNITGTVESSLDDAREKPGQNVAISRLDLRSWRVLNFHRQHFSVASIIQSHYAATPPYSPRLIWPYAYDNKWQGWVWQQSASVFDVFVARSLSQTGGPEVKFNPFAVNADYPRIWLALPQGQQFGFVRVNVTGNNAVLDPQYTVGLTVTTPTPLTAGVWGPSCAVAGQPAHFNANASGGLPPYVDYTFEILPECSGGGEALAMQGEGAPTEGSEIQPGDGGDGGGVLNGLPCGSGANWSFVGSGTNPWVDVTSNVSYKIRVRATDSDRLGAGFQPTMATSAEWPVTVSTWCPNGPGGASASTTDEGTLTPEPTLESTPVVALPTTYALDPPAPNPFATRTRFRFGLPEGANVRLVAYDVLGRQVAVLAEGSLGAGWHEAELDGTNLPRGLYVVRLTAGTFTQTRTVTLTR